MKSTMKKIAASLLALLMMIQLVPALAATYSSGMIVGSAEGYKEALEIVASKGTYVLVGQTLVLDVNEDYEPEWETSNAGAATINGKGVVTAIAEGTATMTATVNSPTKMTASIEVTVIDPGVVLAEGEAEPEGEEGEEEEEPEGEIPEGTEEEEIPEDAEEENPTEQTGVSSKKMLVIVVNGENDRAVYDGEEHLLDRYVTTANEDFFDESKVKIEGELGVTGKDCGIYELVLDGLNFTYDDEEVDARFVINNGFLKITPATVKVTANNATKEEGAADPELTATVEGLYGEDTIEYTLSRAEGEKIGAYTIEATGDEQQGNYRVEYAAGTFEIIGEAGEGTVEVVTSLLPGQKVFKGTEVTLTAVAEGFGNVKLTYQWQYSTDGEHWNDIQGETDETYTYIVNKENSKYYYRVEVDTVH